MTNILHVTATFEDTENAGIKFSKKRYMNKFNGSVKITTVRCDDRDSVRGLSFDAVIFDELAREENKEFFLSYVR